MTNYTMRVTTSPVAGDDWDAHYDFLDDIPGSVLVENPVAPELVFDTDAKNWNAAQMFALGLASLLGLTIIEIKKEGERPSVGGSSMPHVEMVDTWVANSPKRKLSA